MSPHAVSFGTSVRVRQKRTVTITLSNRGSDPLKIRRTTILTTSGCRSFGRPCPLRISSTTSGCHGEVALFTGDRCQVTLAFQPPTTGTLAVAFCVDTLGPLGRIAPPTVTRTCIPVRATVLPGHPASTAGKGSGAMSTTPDATHSSNGSGPGTSSSSSPTSPTSKGSGSGSGSTSPASSNPTALVGVCTTLGTEVNGITTGECVRNETSFKPYQLVYCSVEMLNGRGHTFQLFFVRNGVTVLRGNPYQQSDNDPTYVPLFLEPPVRPGTYTCEASIDGRYADQQGFTVHP